MCRTWRVTVICYHNIGFFKTRRLDNIYVAIICNHFKCSLKKKICQIYSNLLSIVTSEVARTHLAWGTLRKRLAQWDWFVVILLGHCSGYLVLISRRLCCICLKMDCTGILTCKIETICLKEPIIPKKQIIIKVIFSII